MVRRPSYQGRPGVVRQSSYNVNVSYYHPPREDLELSAVLHALSDPQRLRIVRCLSQEVDRPRACGSFGLQLAKSTLTHHFRVLREAGVIAQCADRTARLNSLRRDDLDARFPGLLDAVLAAAPESHTPAATVAPAA